MFSALHNALLEWNRTADNREKMQHLYLAIIVLSVVVAGIVSLIDFRTGRDLLTVTAIAAAIYLVNAILWALLESTVLAKLSGRRKRR